MGRNAHTFKKGQSGNPKGAPKRDWTMTGLIEEALNEQNEDGTPYKKLIAQKLLKLAIKGDMIAIKEVNNRLDGMPQQSLEHSGEIKGSVIVFKPQKLKEDET